MDRDDLVRDTYAHFGLAMFQAQVLELGIVNAMVVARMPERDRLTRNEIDQFMERQFKQTLGRLLHELSKYTELPRDLAQLLARALEQRNWLAHEYFRIRAEDFMTERGCLRMIGELGEAQALFKNAADLLDESLRAVRERFGVSDAEVALEVQRTLTELGELNAQHAVQPTAARSR